MKKSLLIAIPLASAMFFSGCATLFGGGGVQTIKINSSKPIKMSVRYISDDNKTSPIIQKITAPTTITVIRTHKNLLLTNDNNKSKKIIMKKKTNSWFWGDVIATSLLSTTVDAVTGALWKYDNNVTIDSKK